MMAGTENYFIVSSITVKLVDTVNNYFIEV